MQNGYFFAVLITLIVSSSGILSKVPLVMWSGDFDDYGRYRQSANEHWNTMKYYFEEVYFFFFLSDSECVLST